MDFNFSRTFGVGTHYLSPTDLNVLADTTLGVVNFVLPSIEACLLSAASQGYGVGSNGSSVFSINITDIGSNASVNNITVTCNPDDKFNGDTLSAVITQNKGTALIKPVSNNIWNVFISGSGGGAGATGLTGATGLNGETGATGNTGANGAAPSCPTPVIEAQDISVNLPISAVVSVSFSDVVASITGGTPPYVIYGISKDNGVTWATSTNPALATIVFDCNDLGANDVLISVGDSCDGIKFLDNYDTGVVTVQDPLAVC